MMIRLKKIVYLLIGLVLIFSCEAKIWIDHPLVWDMNLLEQMRVDGLKSPLARQLIKTADVFCEAKPVAVTEKNERTFEPDMHYFCSTGPYWWPDSLNTEKYINKDGVVNPESKQYDNVRLEELVRRCKALSQAFYITEDRKYYNAFLRQLQVWFINRDTYMYPTFEYSQVVPGHYGNKGRSTGMISAYRFNTVIESIRLLNGVKKIDNRTMKVVQKWFCAFANDSEDRFGQKFRTVDNNISLAYDITIANMYLFAGKEKRAKEIVDKFNDLRIERQILEDGSQPVELKRTKAFSYSLYNLSHIIDFCFLARYWYPNYYQEHRDRIDKAFIFLEQYVDNKKSFPFQQISDWEKCMKDYQNLLDRIEQLRFDSQ